ncbi:MAG: sigma-70 family RNA polymerase sigma factor [Planctomycetota bacterium]|nr:sigma-70 family RNA polymerase sigma factor [Planctomycetota bacterium]
MSSDSAPDEDLDALRSPGVDPNQALASRFEHHRARLLRMVELRMDPALRQRVNASDVLQEAYLEINNRLGSYLEDPQMPFFLWIRFITAQRLLKLYRFHVGTKKRDVRRQVVAQRGAFPEATSVALVDQLAQSGISPSGVVVESEMRVQLQAALDEMNPIDREVLVLRHYEELSNAETARELGIHEDAASKRYIRALGRLRTVLERMSSDGP